MTEYSWKLRNDLWIFADWTEGKGTDMKASLKDAEITLAKQGHFNAFCDSNGIARLPREAFNGK